MERLWPEQAVSPPSHVMVSPIVKLPALEHKYIASPPMSSLVPIRLTGLLSSKGLKSWATAEPSILLGNGPGAIALNLIPYLPHSEARDLVKLLIPALEIDDGTT